MATVVNTPAQGESSSGMGFMMGMILLLVVLFLLFYYGLPAIRNAGSGGTSVNIPDKVDVNVNPGSGGGTSGGNSGGSK